MRRPLCVFCLGAIAAIILCLRLSPENKPNYDGLDGQAVEAEGTVYRKEYREDTRTMILYLKAVHILTEDRETKASAYQDDSGQFKYGQIQNILCYIETKTEEEEVPEPALGNTVRVTGRIKCFSDAGNPGEFDMRQYYRVLKLDFRLNGGRITAAGGKEYFLRERLYRLKRYFAGVLDTLFEEKEASVMKAMLLGEKSGLDAETKELYRQSSIIHILSISGLHISMIGMGIYGMLKRAGINRKAGALVSIAVICGYGVMTGMSMSAVRAVFMFVLHLTADLAGRTYDMVTALAMAALLLLAEQPLYAGHSGFLFSFGAVAALGVLMPALFENDTGGGSRTGERGGRGGNRAVSKIKQAVSAGICVTLVTLPIHLTFYYQFPIYSIVLNLIVIPLMAVVMGAGLFCMLTGGFAPAPAAAVSYIDRIILRFYEICCRLCEKIPGGTFVSGMPEKWQVFVYTGMILLLAVPEEGKRKLLRLITGGQSDGKQHFQNRRAAVCKMLWIAAALAILLYRPSGGLQVTALDVGQGDCIHIRSAEGRHYLIDGGSSSKSKVAEYQILPYLKAKGIRRLEAVFLTHSDSDHCSGIRELLEEYPAQGIRIGTLVLPDIGTDSRDELFEGIRLLASSHGIAVRYMSRGQWVEDGEMRLTCMHPSAGYETADANAYSLVLYLKYRNFTGLFTGDVEGGGEKDAWSYMEDYLEKESAEAGRLTVLKVAHHGSANSTREEMLEKLLPGISLISCGKNNRYGHPHKELTDRLNAVDSRIYLTAENGAVTVETDGSRVTVSTFKRRTR